MNLRGKNISANSCKQTRRHVTDIDLDKEEDCVNLQKAVARSEGIRRKGFPVLHYKPLFQHPLPLSEFRYQREAILRRLCSAALDKQVAGAVALRDAWALEEVFMRGAPVNVSDSNGFTPLHLAVQVNDIDCITILLHAGADYNARTTTGYTPIQLARTIGALEAENFLREHGSNSRSNTKSSAGETILDIDIPKPSVISILDVLDRKIGLPNRHTYF
jgi:hypothetical protein